MRPRAACELEHGAGDHQLRSGLLKDSERTSECREVRRVSGSAGQGCET